MNRPVAFVDPRRIEAGTLELPVDIAGKDKGAVRQRRAPVPQQFEAGVGEGRPVQRQPVPVKAPGQRGIGAERGGRGDFGKRQPRPSQRRVGTPEAGVAAKVGQPGVDAHAGAGGDNQAVGLADQLRGMVEQIGWKCHDRILRRSASQASAAVAQKTIAKTQNPLL